MNITYEAELVIPPKHEGDCVFVPVCEAEPTHLVCWACVEETQ